MDKIEYWMILYLCFAAIVMICMIISTKREIRKQEEKRWLSQKEIELHNVMMTYMFDELHQWRKLSEELLEIAIGPIEENGLSLEDNGNVIISDKETPTISTKNMIE